MYKPDKVRHISRLASEPPTVSTRWLVGIFSHLLIFGTKTRQIKTIQWFNSDTVDFIDNDTQWMILDYLVHMTIDEVIDLQDHLHVLFLNTHPTTAHRDGVNYHEWMLSWLAVKAQNYCGSKIDIDQNTLLDLLEDEYD